MKTILATLMIFLLLLPVSAHGEIQTISHTVKQPFGGSQSPDDALIAAMAKAKREALEMAGTYIESLTVVKSYQVEKDEILALAAGVLKAEVVSQENYHTKDAFGIDVVVNVVVDTSVLEERVTKLLQDRTHLEQLKQARIREKELLGKIATLEGENRKGAKSKQQSANIKKEFQEVSKGLTAVSWYNKAADLWADGKYTEPGKALDYINEAIRLKPDYVAAYNVRGGIYDTMGQHDRAIKDFDSAIRLKPDYAEAFYGRGLTYDRLGKSQRAIQDYDKAIRLKPNHTLAYYNRGRVYDTMGQHDRAIKDFDSAIRLKPDYAEPYNNRGSVYAKLGQNQRAIEDYDTAIRLKPPELEVAYTNRGIAYWELGQHQRAIMDFDTAISLKPGYAAAYNGRASVYAMDLGQYQRAIEDLDEAIRLQLDYAEAYNNRGLTYLLLGKNNLCCRDAQKACKLGVCRALEIAKSKGLCP